MSIAQTAKLIAQATLIEGVKFVNDIRVRPRPIVIYPDKRLSTPCRKWTDFSKEGTASLCKIAHVMVRTLEAQKTGARLGLAANQCGYDVRVAIILGKFVVNPVFIPVANAPRVTNEEGCYSIPHKTYMVERPPYGWIKYRTVDGGFREEKLNGVSAIVAQHELNHLDGILCSHQES